MMYIGVDLGGTGIKAGVVNEQGEILSKGSTPTMKERPYQDIIHDIATLCKDVAQQAGITMDDVAAIGVGVPGICDAKTGIIPFCTNLGWREVPFVSEMRKYFNLPIIVDNDATVAGYAESVAGVSKGTDSERIHHAGHGRGRRHRDSWQAVFRRTRHRLGNRTYDYQDGRRALHLRQPRLL